MKPLIIATLCLFSLSAQADLIVYTYDSEIVKTGNTLEPDYDAYGTLTVDTQKRRLVAFDFLSEPVRFNWSGEAALIYPVPTAGGWQENGFERVYIPEQNAWFGLWLDLFYLGEGEDIFRNLDKTAPYEGSFVGTSEVAGVETSGYYFRGGLTKTKTIQVPEPATLSLLALGLAAIGIRRRLR